MEYFFSIMSKFLSSIILMFTVVYTWTNLLNKKINYKNKKFYLTLILMTIFSVLNYYIINQYIKIVVITFVLIVLFKFLFETDLHKSIIIPIYTQIGIMISETVFIIIISIIFGFEQNDIITNMFTSLLSNISISLVFIIIMNSKISKKFCNKLLQITEKINKNYLLLFTMIIIIIIYIMGLTIYNQISFAYSLIFNIIINLYFLAIAFYSLKTKNNYIKIYSKYNTTLKSLKEYEEIIDKYRISNHENKNQLLTIRNMLPKKNKDVLNYIDLIVNNKLKDDDKILINASKIPSGGLRGLIYSKLLFMKSNNIEYSLEISKEIKTTELIENISDNLMLDICKIVGVLLDNSIQAVEDLKIKKVNISMYIDNNKLVISISNNYNNKIDLSKIDDIGYTTKSGNHGYGLSLVKQLISNNKELEICREVTKEIFTEKLKIKM